MVFSQTALGAQDKDLGSLWCEPQTDNDCNKHCGHGCDTQSALVVLG